MSGLIKPHQSAVVDELIHDGHLTRVPADPSLAEVILANARGKLRSAQRALDEDDLGECAAPLWAGFRLACTAVLQAQGLRIHGEGHHARVVEAVTEQYGHLFGGLLRPGRRLREQRREAEYPTSANPQMYAAAEVQRDIESVSQLIDAADTLIPLAPVYPQ